MQNIEVRFTLMKIEGLTIRVISKQASHKLKEKAPRIKGLITVDLLGLEPRLF
jgi:hypothetical protein